MFVNSINPILFENNFLAIRWYGLFLGIAVLLSVLLLHRLFVEKNYRGELALDLSLYLIIGGLVGARLGHILFYNFTYFLAYPQEIIFINHGGLSSHGLTVGLLVSFFLFCKVKKIKWKEIVDLIVIPIPILIFFIRLGNFFNSEIVGRSTDLPWGIKYLNFEYNQVFRHPSQLYEALIGILIFVVIFYIYKKYKNLPQLYLVHIFIFLYFTSRFLIEFTKEFQVLTSDFGLTMGQFLSLPFIIYGILFFYNKKYNNKKYE